MADEERRQKLPAGWERPAAAEAWLGRAASQPIKPTELQSQYIAASRAAATRAQRRNLTIATVVAVVASALAIVAVIQYFRAKRETVVADEATARAVEQRKEADRQRDIATEQRAEAVRQRDVAEHETRIATSGRLAATAIGLKDSQLDVASLLGIEAGRVEPTFDSLNAQVTLFETSPDLMRYLRQPGAGDSFIDSIAFSPDGKRFATGTDEGVITLWDARTRRPTETLPRPSSQSDAFQIAFSPDSSILAVAYYNDVGVQLWNVAGPHPKPIQPAVSLQPESPCCVAFDPTGNLIAAGGNGVQVWARPRQLLPVKPKPKTGKEAPFVRGLAFSPVDPLLLAYTVGDTVHLENSVMGQSRGELRLPSSPGKPPNTDPLGPIAFSPDGTQIAVGPENGTVAIWKIERKGDTYSGSLRETLALGDNGIPMGLAFRPDGKELVAISNHGAMRKWDTASLKLLRDYPPTLTVDIRSLAFSRDGSQIFVGLSNGTMLIWNDVDSSLPVVDRSQYPESSGSVFNAGNRAGAPKQPWVTASGAAARLTAAGVEVRAHGRTFVLPGSPPQARHLAISPDGRYVAASSIASISPTRGLWDISQAIPRAIPIQGKDNMTFALEFGPSSDILATAEFTGLYLWDTATGKLIGENVEPNRTSSINLAISPDGGKVAVVLNGGEVLLVDTATQRVLGTHVFAGTEDFAHEPSTVAFSQDGRSLFIHKGDGTVLKWDADEKGWAARACHVAGRNLSMDEWRRYIGDTIPYHRTCSEFPAGEGVAK